MSLRQAHLKDTKAPLMTGENPATHIFQKFHVISSSIWKSFGFKTQQQLNVYSILALNYFGLISSLKGSNWPIFIFTNVEVHCTKFRVM